MANKFSNSSIYRILFLFFFCFWFLPAKSQWSQMSVNVDDLKSIYFTSKDTGYVAGNSGNILKTTDGGVHWTSLRTGTEPFTEIKFSSQNIGYVTSYGYNTFKTIDGGATWTALPLTIAYYDGIACVSDTEVYVVGNGSLIKKTMDGGATWTSHSFGGGKEFAAIDMINQTTGYAAGFDYHTGEAILYKTTDAGTNWTGQVFSRLPEQLVFWGLYFTDTLNGYVVGHYVDSSSYQNVGIIYKTTDAGSTWSSTSLYTSSHLRDVQFVNDSVGFIAGEIDALTGCGTNIVYKTTDRGTTWNVESTGPSIYGLNSIHFPTEDIGYALEDCSGPGAVGGFLKYNTSGNCFAYYSVIVDSATAEFTLTIDSTTAAQAISYFWDFGDGTTSNLATPYHIVSLDTAYNVCMKIYTADGDSCQYCHLIGKNYLSNFIRTTGYTINILLPSSIITNTNAIGKAEKSPKIFPNPGIGSFNLYTSSPENTANVNVYDIDGKIVFRQSELRYNSVIDLTPLNAGIYFIEILEKDTISRIKLIKLDSE